MRPTIIGVLGGLVLLAGSQQAMSSDEGSQSPYGVVKNGTTHSAFFGLDFDDNRGIVVGTKGIRTVIFESPDGGETWNDVESPAVPALLSVAAEGGKAVAVGVSGTVVTGQAGQNWLAVDSGVTRRLLAVDMNREGLVIAVGAFGTVMRSRDWGKTWESKPPQWSKLVTRDNPSFAEPTLYGVDLSDSGQITLAGEFGLIVRSDDEGETWRFLTTPKAGTPTLNAVLVHEAGRSSFAVGQEGLILESKDGGETWDRAQVSTGKNFHNLAVSQSGEVIVTGMRVMYRSPDGGESWQEVGSQDARADWYQSVRVEPGSGRIYAVGHSGRIIRFES